MIDRYSKTVAAIKAASQCGGVVVTSKPDRIHEIAKSLGLQVKVIDQNGGEVLVGYSQSLEDVMKQIKGTGDEV